MAELTPAGYENMVRKFRYNLEPETLQLRYETWHLLFLYCKPILMIDRVSQVLLSLWILEQSSFSNWSQRDSRNHQSHGLKLVWYVLRSDFLTAPSCWHDCTQIWVLLTKLRSGFPFMFISTLSAVFIIMLGVDVEVGREAATRWSNLQMDLASSHRADWRLFCLRLISFTFLPSYVMFVSHCFYCLNRCSWYEVGLRWRRCRILNDISLWFCKVQRNEWLSAYNPTSFVHITLSMRIQLAYSKI